MEEESTQDRGEPCAPRLGDFNPSTGKVYYGNGVWDYPPTTTSTVAAGGGAGGCSNASSAMACAGGASGGDGKVTVMGFGNRVKPNAGKSGQVYVHGQGWMDPPKVSPCAVTKEQVGLGFLDKPKIPPMTSYQFMVPENVRAYNGMLAIGNIRWQLKMDPIGEHKLKHEGEMAQRWRAFIKELLIKYRDSVTEYPDGRFDVAIKFTRVTGEANESSMLVLQSGIENGYTRLVEVRYKCPKNSEIQQDRVAFYFDPKEPDVVRFDANFDGLLGLTISSVADLDDSKYLLPPSADTLKAYAGIIAFINGKKPYKATVDDTGHLVRVYDRDPEPTSEQQPSNVMTLTEMVQQSGTSLAHDGRDTRVMVDGKRHRTLVVGPADQAESWSLFVQELREKAKAWNCIDNEDVITYKWITDHKVPQTLPYSVLPMFFRDEQRGRDPMMSIQYNPSLSPVDDTQISHHTLWIEFDRDGKDTLSIESDFLGLAVIEFHVPLIQKAADEPVKRADDAFDCHPNLLVVRRI